MVSHMVGHAALVNLMIMYAVGMVYLVRMIT